MHSHIAWFSNDKKITMYYIFPKNFDGDDTKKKKRKKKTLKKLKNLTHSSQSFPFSLFRGPRIPSRESKSDKPEMSRRSRRKCSRNALEKGENGRSIFTVKLPVRWLRPNYSTGNRGRKRGCQTFVCSNFCVWRLFNRRLSHSVMTIWFLHYIYLY